MHAVGCQEKSAIPRLDKFFEVIEDGRRDRRDIFLAEVEFLILSNVCSGISASHVHVFVPQ